MAFMATGLMENMKLVKDGYERSLARAREEVTREQARIENLEARLAEVVADIATITEQADVWGAMEVLSKYQPGSKPRG